jgi:hypothetical protein
MSAPQPAKLDALDPISAWPSPFVSLSHGRRPKTPTSSGFLHGIVDFMRREALGANDIGLEETARRAHGPGEYWDFVIIISLSSLP